MQRSTPMAIQIGQYRGLKKGLVEDSVFKVNKSLYQCEK